MININIGINLKKLEMENDLYRTIHDNNINTKYGLIDIPINIMMIKEIIEREDLLFNLKIK